MRWALGVTGVAGLVNGGVPQGAHPVGNGLLQPAAREQQGGDQRRRG